MSYSALMKGRWVVTAQRAVSSSEAYVALCRRRVERGESGEASVAILHTVDEGASWTPVGWRRSLRTFASRALLAPWPPEYVVTMELPNGQLEIEFWEDWGMSGRPGEDFETGRRTEPIWRALLREGRWTIRMRRRWRSSDGTFGPHPVPFGLSGFQPPRELLEAP